MLLARLLRIIAATGIIKAVGEDVYAHTPFSLAYIEGSEVDFFTLWYVSVIALWNGPKLSMESS